MSYTTPQILSLAQDIYTTIGSPTNQSVAFISGWITDSGTLGSLNNKLFTSFYLTGADPDITDANGNFGPEEADILSLSYEVYYYKQQAVVTLQNGNTFWTSLTEGDSKLARERTTDVSARYSALGTEANRLLRLAIHDYQWRIVTPQSISASQSFGYPPA